MKYVILLFMNGKKDLPMMTIFHLRYVITTVSAITVKKRNKNQEEK